MNTAVATAVYVADWVGVLALKQEETIWLKP